MNQNTDSHKPDVSAALIQCMREKGLRAIPFKIGFSERDVSDMIVLYDTGKVTEKEVSLFLCQQNAYHPYILVMHQEQWDNMFDSVSQYGENQ